MGFWEWWGSIWGGGDDDHTATTGGTRGQNDGIEEETGDGPKQPPEYDSEY